jgi:hypothetical protein
MKRRHSVRSSVRRSSMVAAPSFAQMHRSRLPSYRQNPRARVEAEDESEALCCERCATRVIHERRLVSCKSHPRQVCSERKSNQLKYLAGGGFSASANTLTRGDISPFTERLRLHVLSDKLFTERVRPIRMSAARNTLVGSHPTRCDFCYRGRQPLCLSVADCW